MILRRLVAPFTLHDESERPSWLPYGDWVRDETRKTDWVYVPWESTVKAEGLLEASYKCMASPTGTAKGCNVPFSGVAA